MHSIRFLKVDQSNKQCPATFTPSTIDITELNGCALASAGIPVTEECKDLISKVLIGDPASRFSVQQIQQHRWYTQDLPPGVIHMNDECLKLRDHSAGFQSDAEIQSIVMQAIGTRPMGDEDDYIDDVMVRLTSAL